PEPAEHNEHPKPTQHEQRKRCLDEERSWKEQPVALRAYLTAKEAVVAAGILLGLRRLPRVIFETERHNEARGNPTLSAPHVQRWLYDHRCQRPPPTAPG